MRHYRAYRGYRHRASGLCSRSTSRSFDSAGRGLSGGIRTTGEFQVRLFSADNKNSAITGELSLGFDVYTAYRFICLGFSGLGFWGLRVCRAWRVSKALGLQFGVYWAYRVIGLAF